MIIKGKFESVNFWEKNKNALDKAQQFKIEII